MIHGDMGSLGVQSLLLLTVLGLTHPHNLMCASCPVTSTFQVEMVKEVLIRLAKQNILNKLHLKERPNMTEPVSRAMLATALRKLQGRRRGQDRILEIPWVEQEQRSEGFTPEYEIISFAESECADAPHTCLNFQLPVEKTENTEIFIVHIWLFLQASHSSKKVILRSSLSDRNGLEQVFISQKQLEVKGSGWHTLSIISSTYKMLSRQQRRLRIELMCKDCQDLPLMVNNGETQRSFLIAKARAKELVQTSFKTCYARYLDHIYRQQIPQLDCSLSENKYFLCFP
ncbi:inhibin beta B chain isoform X2 [Microcaecilia unicolor]|uniref:Inhibin beta B chain-like isoform X2 n=1 Tax=Microcaecilia unicolor TaxID=1415580 RepID=A0A6P7XH22_9AMPH|nr:inhibin beta B chain-like isoform X2 [Microcaecilia unicolor]